MNIKKRLENLERGFGCGNSLTLVMPDGSRKVLALQGRYGILDLTLRCLCEPHCGEAELIRASVSQVDSNGGHMGELIWSILHSAVEASEP